MIIGRWSQDKVLLAKEKAKQSRTIQQTYSSESDLWLLVWLPFYSHGWNNQAENRLQSLPQYVMNSKSSGASFSISTINFVHICFCTIMKKMEYCWKFSNLLFYLFKCIHFDFFFIFLRIEIEKYWLDQYALTCGKNESRK
jgi:hypothetical protein